MSDFPAEETAERIPATVGECEGLPEYEVAFERAAQGCENASEREGTAEGPVIDGDNLRVFPRTMFGTAYVYDVETEDGDPVRLLEVGGVFESATYLDERRFEPTFEYYRAFDHLFEAVPEPQRVLMIGGGGYAYPKHFVASQPYGAMDVVEIDPVITRIAREHFFLGELMERFSTRETGRLNLVTADGRAYLEQRAAELACVRTGAEPDSESFAGFSAEDVVAAADPATAVSASVSFASPAYEAIINDSFSGAEATSSLLDDAGLAAVKACLVPEGLYLINVICDIEEDARDLLRVVEVLRTRFAHVHVIPCVDEVFGDADNNLVIATDGAYSFTGCLPPFNREE